MWAVQPTPAPGGVARPVSATLAAISCPSARECIAVGSLPATGGTTVLVDRFNGIRWARSAAPSPGGTRTGDYSTFTGISCTSSTQCEAVGTYTDGSNGGQSFAESWDGTRWSAQTIPVPSGQSGDVALAGVSCTSASACVAVGSYSVGTTTDPIAEVWNGSDWTPAVLTVPAGAGGGQLSAVSCPAANACQAVGSYEDANGGADPLVEAWNGSTWREAALPLPAGAVPFEQIGGLSGLSCTSPSSCVAVGSYSTSTQTQVPYSEVMSGTAWSVVPVPFNSMATAPSTGLSAVTCTAVVNCTAAGIIGRQLLVDRFNGTDWSVQRTASAPRTTYVDSAGGVACTGVGCVVVGSDAVGNPYVHTDYALAETQTTSGRWSLHSPLLKAVVTSSELNAISCASSSACMAVGDVTAGGTHALAERWNGNRFTIQSLNTPTAELGAVSCPTANWCMAVGATNFDSTTAIQSSLALVWSGSRWTRAGAPPGAILDSVSCVAPDACIAVGPDNVGASWNGSRWSELTLPGIPGLTLSFGGVSCSSSGYCTIVGEATGYCPPDSGTCNVRDVVIAERHSGGRRWTLQRPVQAFGPVGLIACPATDRCIAVGVAGQVWSGGRWVAQRIPGGGVILSALACTAADACTAVGSGHSGATPAAVGWNGSRWSAQAIPAPRRTGPSPVVALNGVACPSRGFCLAVGSRTDARGLNVPFAERDS